jgi:preprotein translocase subunit YajC
LLHYAIESFFPKDSTLLSTLETIPFLIAQAPPAEGGLKSLLPMAIMVGLVVVYYFLIVGLPQKRLERERRNMLTSLKKNDKVLTSGGIYGTVVSVDEKQDRVTVRICDDPAVRVQFNVRSVARVLRDDEPA